MCEQYWETFNWIWIPHQEIPGNWMENPYDIHTSPSSTVEKMSHDGERLSSVGGLLWRLLLFEQGVVGEHIIPRSPTTGQITDNLGQVSKLKNRNKFIKYKSVQCNTDWAFI